MAHVLKDRVRETSTTIGTGAIALDGAVPGCQPFSAISVGNTCWYCITGPSGSWETGVGTLSASATLQRTLVLDSSSGGAAVSFAAGPKDVFCALPANFGASAAEVRALTDASKPITPKALVDAVAFVTETADASYAPDFSEGMHRDVQLSVNTVFGQPAGLKDGMSVVCYFKQDATGSRTLSFNATYHRFAGGVVPAMSTASLARDRLSGIARNIGGTLVIDWGGLQRAFA